MPTQLPGNAVPLTECPSCIYWPDKSTAKWQGWQGWQGWRKRDKYVAFVQSSAIRNGLNRRHGLLSGKPAMRGGQFGFKNNDIHC